MGFLLFFILFIFFKEFKINKLYLIGIILISILSVSINIVYTPQFTEHTQLEKDTLKILEEVDTNFYMGESYSSTSYSRAYYSYAPIYLNLSSPSGWYKIPSVEYINEIINLKESISNKKCKEIIKNSKELNNDYLILYESDCEFMEQCNTEKINQINNVCLHKIK